MSRTWLPFSILLALSIQSLAANAAENDPAVTVKLPPGSDATDVDQNGIKLLRHGKKSEIPAPWVRDQVFAESGVMANTEKMDALDRDMLYFRASRLPVDKLSEMYPTIDKTRLALLSQKVKALQAQRKQTP